MRKLVVAVCMLMVGCGEDTAKPADPVAQGLNECRRKLYAIMLPMQAAFRESGTGFGAAMANAMDEGKRTVDALTGPDGLAECKRRLP